MIRTDELPCIRKIIPPADLRLPPQFAPSSIFSQQGALLLPPANLSSALRYTGTGTTQIVRSLLADSLAALRALNGQGYARLVQYERSGWQQ